MIQTEFESTTGKAYITISLPILIPWFLLVGVEDIVHWLQT
jgi:hypothetical protein